MKLHTIVFNYAYIIKATEKNIENPLREAWKRVKLAFRILNDNRGTIEIFAEAYQKAKFCSDLRKAFKKGSVQFSFLKKNGQVRQAIGTALTGDKYARKTDSKKDPSANGFYFDLEKKASRCFKVQNLIVENGFQLV